MRTFTIVVKVPEDFADHFDAYGGNDTESILADILIGETEWLGVDIEVVSIVEEE